MEGKYCWIYLGPSLNIFMWNGSVPLCRTRRIKLSTFSEYAEWVGPNTRFEEKLWTNFHCAYLKNMLNKTVHFCRICIMKLYMWKYEEWIWRYVHAVDVKLPLNSNILANTKPKLKKLLGLIRSTHGLLWQKTPFEPKNLTIFKCLVVSADWLVYPICL